MVADRSKQQDIKDGYERYACQLALPGMNRERQAKLKRASVLIMGSSPSGAACALHLAQAGVGHLILADNSLVQRSDLSSYLLFSEQDIDRPKIEIIKDRLSALNPEVKVEGNRQKLTPHNAETLLPEADIAVDALESWQDKLLASDTCMRLEKPLVHCGIMAYNFHVFSMIPTRSACLRCVFAQMGLEDFPPDGIPKGMLGAVASLAGAFQAAEVIKWITQIGAISGNHLLRFDVLRSEFDDLTELTGRADCPDCGRND